jgi:C4-type Zn-finger protein
MEVVEFKYEFTCLGCGAKLRAAQSDVKTGYFGANYGGDTPYKALYVTCPVCDRDHELRDVKLP